MSIFRLIIPSLKTLLFLYKIFLLASAVNAELNNNIFFSVDWPEQLVDPNILSKEFQTNLQNIALSNEPPYNEYMLMTTADKEKYVCKIPNAFSQKHQEPKTYLNPYSLLMPLFNKHFPCTYRLEQYWNYELCHGKSIRQFHEDLPIFSKSVQEYYLGTYNVEKFEAKMQEFDKDFENDPNAIIEFPKIKLDELADPIPYVEINMTDGTLCDLNGQPRKTRVKYICHPEGKHEIFSIKEVSICEYEIISQTPLLCLHPSFVRNHIKSQAINCYAIDGAPQKPKRLTKLEEEFLETELENITPTKEPNINLEPEDPNLIKDFLSGHQCLQGGNGWWKYEFCYGKKVEQYHEEQGKKVATILLGTWNEENHVKWLKQNPNKHSKQLPKPQHVYHFYGNGDICDITNKPRSVEVKLKCKENKGHPSAVTLYLSEHRVCEYTLGVESPIICELIERMDQNALVNL